MIELGDLLASARVVRLRLAVPEPIELAARLRAVGLPIDSAALSVEAIADELARLMSVVPPWAAGIPLAAAGFEATRYRKE